MPVALAATILTTQPNRISPNLMGVPYCLTEESVHRHAKASAKASCSAGIYCSNGFILLALTVSHSLCLSRGMPIVNKLGWPSEGNGTVVLKPNVPPL